MNMVLFLKILCWKINDIILGKIVPIKEHRNDHTKVIKYRDMSRVYRTKEESYIDKNYMIEMEKDILLQKSEHGSIEFQLSGINLVLDMDKREL